MADIKIGHINISETGTVTAVSSHASYPLRRLYDRYWNINWKSGSTGTYGTMGVDKITNGGFSSGTTGWTTDDECTILSVSGGYSGNALTVYFYNGTDGSNLISDGDFESTVSPWTYDSSEYSATIVGSGYSGNAVNINNSVKGSNLLTNPGFETGDTTGWSATNGAIAVTTPGDSGSYCGTLNFTNPANTILTLNDSFETWISSSEAQNWTASGATIAQSTSSSSGTYAANITCTLSTDHVYQDVSGLTIGQTYLLTSALRQVSGTGSISIRDSGGTEIDRASVSSVSTSNYGRIGFIFVATTSTMRVCLGASVGQFLYDLVYLIEYETNLLSNGSFETGTTTPTGWSVDSGVTGTLSTTRMHGTKSWQLSGTTATNGGYQNVSGLIIGRTYIVGVFSRAISGSTARISVNTTVTTEATTTIYTDRWAYLLCTFVANSTTHKITFGAVASVSALYDSSFMMLYPDYISYITQLVNLTPSTEYKATVRYKDGTLSGQGISLVARRGSTNVAYGSSSYTTTSSWSTATITFTVPPDETSMYIGVSKNTTSTGNIQLDTFTLYATGTSSQQYLQYELTGFTVGKRYRVSGYVLKPTVGDDGNYIIAAYKGSDSSLISSVSGVATTSWVAFSSLDFTAPAGETTINIRLIRNSSADGDMRFDSVSCYHLNYAPNGQSAYQNIATTAGYEYRVTVYVKDGIVAGGSPALTTHPYEVNIYSSTGALIDSDTGSTSSSWTQKTIDFTATDSLTKIELQKASTTTGNIAFDSVTMYQLGISYVDQWIQINQSSSAVEIDALVIPANHTLNNLSCQFQYSTDGVSWTDGVTDWTQSGSSVILKQLSSPLTRNYWRLYVTGSYSEATLPSMGEFYVTKLYTFVSQPKQSSIREGFKSNITRIESEGSGRTDLIINGVHRKTYEYELPYISSSEKTQLETIRDACMGKKPFFMVDHQGNNVFVEFTEDIVFTPIRYGYYSATLKLMEAL